VLEEADRNASSTVFIDFMLDVIGSVLLQNSTAIQGRSDQATDQVTDQATGQVKRLLAVMDDGGYWTAQDLMARLSLSHRPTFRKNYLNPALQADLLVMQYPEMPRSPKQRYRKRS
jgi:hypothetical protein